MQSGERLAVDVLPQLQRLEELSLWVDAGLYSYNGELAAGLPRLRSLDVSCELKRESQSSPNRTLDCTETGVVAPVVDLLRGAAKSLQHLRIRFDEADVVPYPPALLEAVSRCVELTCLRLDCLPFDVTVVRGLARLHTLDLVLHEDENEADEDDDLVAACTRALRHCDSLRGLRELRVDFEASFVSLIEMPLVAELFETLASAAASATRLRLGAEALCSFPQLAREMVRSMPRLQVVELHSCRVGDLLRLLDLEDLKEVTATVKCTAETEDHCKRAFEGFRRQRPNVKATLSIAERNSYWFHQGAFY